MVIDPVSNLIISLKNASKVGLSTVVLPYSRMQSNILNTLKKEGYVEDYVEEGKDIKKNLEVTLKYEDGKPVINDVKRISKFSRRVYVGAKDIRSVKRGYGSSVISTPNGIVSGREAKKSNAGGEILFEIW
ncbi:MAG: small subunit ribosomal protein S8 [Candidatus Paceibacteria bacterium]|jgi:small subunit ribosomal protein S8